MLLYSITKPGSIPKKKTDRPSQIPLNLLFNCEEYYRKILTNAPAFFARQKFLLRGDERVVCQMAGIEKEER